MASFWHCLSHYQLDYCYYRQQCRSDRSRRYSYLLAGVQLCNCASASVTRLSEVSSSQAWMTSSSPLVITAPTTHLSLPMVIIAIVTSLLLEHWPRDSMVTGEEEEEEVPRSSVVPRRDRFRNTWSCLWWSVLPPALPTNHSNSSWIPACYTACVHSFVPKDGLSATDYNDAYFNHVGGGSGLLLSLFLSCISLLHHQSIHTGTHSPALGSLKIICFRCVKGHN